MLDKWQAMWVEKDDRTKEWYVCRMERDGYISVTPFTFKTKARAVDYIRSHGLKPSKNLTDCPWRRA